MLKKQQNSNTKNHHNSKRSSLTACLLFPQHCVATSATVRHQRVALYVAAAICHKKIVYNSDSLNGKIIV